VGGLEVLKFAEESVVFGVADLGLIEDVIEPVVALDFLPEIGGPSGDVGRHQREIEFQSRVAKLNAAVQA